MKKKLTFFLCAFLAFGLIACDRQTPVQSTALETEVTADYTETAVTTAYNNPDVTVPDVTEEIPVTSETEVSIDYIPIPVTTEQTTHTVPPETSAEPIDDVPLEFDYKTSDLSEYIILGKYRGIEVFVEAWEPITEEQLDVELELYVEDLLESAVILDGNCKNGDRVNIDFYGTIDGEPFYGGEGEGYVLTLGNHEYIIDVDGGIIGMEVGETRTVEAVFPSDYGTDAYNGKTAVFEVTLNYIYPALTDALVAEHTDFATVKELRESIRDEAKAEAFAVLSDAALTKAMANSYIIKLPDAEVQKTFENTVNMNKLLALMLRVPYEQFLADSYGITPAEADSIFMEYSKNDVEQRILIYAIARDMGIDVRDNATESELLVTMGYLSLEELMAAADVTEEQIEEYKYNLIREKVVSAIVAEAKYVETLS